MWSARHRIYHRSIALSSNIPSLSLGRTDWEGNRNNTHVGGVYKSDSAAHASRLSQIPLLPSLLLFLWPRPSRRLGSRWIVLCPFLADGSPQSKDAATSYTTGCPSVSKGCE